MSKKKIYFFQINTPTDRNLLPLSAGMIVSYAKSIPIIQQNYDFTIEIQRSDPTSTTNSFLNPDVIAFSCYSWNLQQSLEIARLVKKKWPDCLIIFGGPSSPSSSYEISEFSKENPFVDVFVHGEGEIAFSEILIARIQNKGLNEIKGISYINRDSSLEIITNPCRPMNDNLDALSSPFFDGTFDDIMEKHGKDITGALWETNRGCPFSCTFCYWGQVQRSKIRQFGLDRLYAELEWMSRKKIEYVYAADANFGILQRDIYIAKKFAALCKKTGYPNFFMVNWTKHSSKTILKIAEILKKGGVRFRVTLSMQSLNKETLKAVKRYNMEMSEFYDSIKEANKKNLSTYTDLILGLPCETYDSFISGLNQVSYPLLNHHLSIYLCRLLTGSEMADPQYIKKYKIETRTCLVEMGRRKTLELGLPEYEKIIVSTSTLPIEKWKELCTFSYMTIPLYNFRLAFFVLNYLKYEYLVNVMDTIGYILEQAQKSKKYGSILQAINILKKVQESILNNESSVTKLDLTGATCWEPYEAAFLSLISNKDSFYQELWNLIQKNLKMKKINVNQKALREVFAYQIACIQRWGSDNKINLLFSLNIPQYFESLSIKGAPTKMVPKRTFSQFGEDSDCWKDASSFANSKLEGGHTFHTSKVRISPGCNSKDIKFEEAIDFLKNRIKGGVNETI